MCLSLLMKLFGHSGETENIEISGNTNNAETSGNTDNIETAVTITEENTEIMEDYNGNVILIDCGHSEYTPGKRMRKDDGTYFYEYASNRIIGRLVAAKLDKLGIKYHFVLDLNEKTDKSLSARADTANEYVNKYGINKCLFISLHSNAVGNGIDFKDNARGWCVYTTKGETKSDAIATMFFEEASKVLPDYGMTLRKETGDGDPDYEENFTVIYKTKCPAILLEQLFFTSRIDLKFLESANGQEVLSDIVVNGIKRFCTK